MNIKILQDSNGQTWQEASNKLYSLKKIETSGFAELQEGANLWK